MLDQIMNEWMKYLCMLLIDIVLLGLFILWNNPDESISIEAVYIVPLIFIINILIAVVFIFINHRTSILFGVNAFIAPLIFFFFFIGWFKYKHWEQYQDWHFLFQNEQYELSIHKKSNEFDVCKLVSGGSNGICYGYYRKINDTIYFNDTISSHNIHHFFMVKDSLFGFPTHGSKITLNH